MLLVQVQKKLASFQLEVDIKLTGGITAIFGPSGSGKTQLARLISGLETPDAGMIKLGDDVLFNGTTKSVPAHKRRIGYVFQDYLLFPHKSVKGNLIYGLPKSPKFNLNEIIQTLDLKNLLDRKPAQLSGGESQRVAIGRALLSEPQLLIMDEPLSSLDQTRRDEILSLIEKIRDQFGLQILYITHSLEEVLRLADNLVLLRAGKIRAAGPLGDVLSRHDLIAEKDGIGIGSVFSGTVAHMDATLKLTTLSTAAGALYVSSSAVMSMDNTVRIRIRARDITLATHKITNISTLNQLNGIITEIHHTQNGSVIVKIDAGLQLNAAITLKSLQDLNLAVGSPVWALIKSVTVNSIEQ